MQWNNLSNAGFTSNPKVKPWLKVSDSYKKINVSNSEKDPSSLYNCYKRLINVRGENTALQVGKFEFINLNESKKKCLTYRRISEKQDILVYLNFSQKKIVLKVPKQNLELIFSTNAFKKETNDGDIKLNPFEGIILK